MSVVCMCVLQILAFGSLIGTLGTYNIYLVVHSVYFEVKHWNNIWLSKQNQDIFCILFNNTSLMCIFWWRYNQIHIRPPKKWINQNLGEEARLLSTLSDQVNLLAIVYVIYLNSTYVIDISLKIMHEKLISTGFTASSSHDLIKMYSF